MKRLTLTVVLFLIFSITASLVHGKDAVTYFAYPHPPESLPVGTPRANYYVEHFWDHCPWKSAFSSNRKMADAFMDYAEMLPLANRDTVFISIDRLIDKVKKRPENLLALTRMAEAAFYSDSAIIPSDEVYLPFAKAVAGHKKIKGADHDYFARQANVISHSQEGMTLPPAEIILSDGSTAVLNDTTCGAGEYVIIFDTPGSSAAMMARTRFAANIAARQLVDAGILKPIFLYPGTPDKSWWKNMATLPQSWTVVAMPSAPDMIDLRIQPTIYIADSSMRITKKFMSMPLLIAACEKIIQELNHSGQ